MLQHIARNRSVGFELAVSSAIGGAGRPAGTVALAPLLHSHQSGRARTADQAREPEIPAKAVESAARRALDACLSSWHYPRLCSGAMAWQRLLPAYSPWARENHLIHDIHLKPADAIPAAALAAKQQDAIQGRLRIAYAGRLDAMKAPLDWLRALGAARDLGAEFEAVWLGTVRYTMTFKPALTSSDCVTTYAPLVSSPNAQRCLPSCAVRTSLSSLTSRRNLRDAYWRHSSPVLPLWAIRAPLLRS